MKHTRLTPIDRRRRGGGPRRSLGRVAALAAGVLLAMGGGRAVAGAATRPVFQPFATACSNAFFDGDMRLGPAQLESFGPVAPILAGYHRLAGLSPAAFIAKYWDQVAGGWRYPPQNGFLLGPGGRPIEFVGRLSPGVLIDRFGSEFGGFLAPFDEPYDERALPPQSLDNFDPAYTCNYHEYRVVKSFATEEGPIAPGFGQVGRGLQYQLVGSLVPGASSRLNVRWLIDNGYLARTN